MAGSNAAKKSQGLKATDKMIKDVPKKNITLSLVFSNCLEDKISPNPRIQNDAMVESLVRYPENDNIRYDKIRKSKCWVLFLNPICLPIRIRPVDAQAICKNNSHNPHGKIKFGMLP